MTLPPRPRQEPRLHPAALGGEDGTLAPQAAADDHHQATIAPEAAGFGDFVASEACETCVKFIRAVAALLLDGAIAIVAIFLVRWVGKAINYELGGQMEDYASFVEPIHHSITAGTLIAYGAWGIWDGIKCVRRETLLPAANSADNVDLFARKRLLVADALVDHQTRQFSRGYAYSSPTSFGC